MDSYRVIDNIQVEKANALARYKRLNNIKKMFMLMEFLVVVALISWSTSYVPDGFKVVGGYIYACSCYILNQHVVFLLVVPQGFENNYAKYETSETVSQVVPPLLPVVDNSPQMKETVVAEESEGKIVENENVIVKTECEIVAEKTIKQAAKQIERFNRTQSARLKREMSMRPCRELRRSVTDSRRTGRDLDTDRRKSDADSTVDRRKSDVDSTVGRRKSDGGSPVDRLSNEEFRLTIEAFILNQRSLIKQQARVEQSY
nr:protein translocase subunit SECA like [Tanacetum cinerariifolium]